MIDHNGIIRAKNIRGKQIDQWIDKLLPRGHGRAEPLSPGTVLFDFDSTLIDRESLDEMLSESLAQRPGDAARVRAITDAGMEGRLDFGESLAQRLAIASPTRAQVEAFGHRAIRHLTSGWRS